MNPTIHNLATQFAEAIIAEHFRVRLVQYSFDSCTRCSNTVPRHELMYCIEPNGEHLAHPHEEYICGECCTIEEFSADMELDPDGYTTHQNTYADVLKEMNYVKPFDGGMNDHGAHCMVCYDTINNCDLVYEACVVDIDYGEANVEDEPFMRHTCASCCNEIEDGIRTTEEFVMCRD